MSFFEDKDLLDNSPETRNSYTEDASEQNRHTVLAIIVVFLCFVGFILGMHAAFG